MARASTTWRGSTMTGQYAKAEPLFERALAIWKKALGTEHPTWPPASTTWRGCTRTRAVREGRAAVPAGPGDREKALGTEHPDVARCLENYMFLLLKRGNGNDAATRRNRKHTSDLRTDV